MSLETGKIYDGKVRNIAPYGAFVEITLDGKVHVGMVHISEISNTYVNEIKDHLSEGQEVKVKVLNIDENGKTSLSIKKAMDNPVPRPRQQVSKTDRSEKFERTDRPERNGQRNFGNREGSNGVSRPQAPAKPQTPESAFEDMLSKFKQSSEEKMSDLKRNIDSKRRSARRGK
ncbi:MAG: S1 RNA-binding domain-containing protein [Oscillospiraceae bacterium]|nr:S1 RNA-binding domain-containing protein [Oscillospiraceae bacterium]